MTEKIEYKVAKTILEKEMEVEIGGKVFKVAPPTTATLIMVSEIVARLPRFRKVETSEDILKESLRVAKDCKMIVDLPAVIILGANNLYQHNKIVKKRFWGLFKEKRETVVDKKKELVDFMLNNMSPKELNQLIVKLLMTLEIGDFFGFTTSLAEINLLKPTKGEVETTMTVSGQ